MLETNNGIQLLRSLLEKAFNNQNKQLNIIVKIKNKGMFFIS